MARSTVFRYRGRALDAQEVGRTLQVRAVLTGQVIERDKRLSIRLELMDVADGSHLWGGHYDRELGELPVLEEAIAQEIAAKLRPGLTRRAAEATAPAACRQRRGVSAPSEGTLSLEQAHRDGAQEGHRPL